MQSFRKVPRAPVSRVGRFSSGALACQVGRSVVRTFRSNELRSRAALMAAGLFASWATDALAQSQPPGAPCLARATAVIADTGGVLLNSNSLVDSYQSSLGPYGGSNVGSQGNVRAATSIVLNSGAIVKGTLTPNSPAGLQPIRPPPSATSLGTLLVNSGQTLTLAAGSYVATSVTLNSNASLVVSGGPVLIWVTGSLVIGGPANAGGPPANLQFLVTDRNDVNVNSGGLVHGVIYAPGAHVNLNATVFGSVVGDQVSIFNSGSSVHYDQSEACAAPPPAGPQVAAGAFGSCAIRSGGSVECWGNNSVGQLGNGTSGSIATTPVQVQGLTGAVSITQGNDHTCALLSSGTVECWGDNEFGELGVGTTTGPAQCSQGSSVPATACSTTPVAVPGLTGVVSIAAGNNHTCAVLGTGGVECWGSNTFGGLGDGTTTSRSSPVTVSGVSGARSVSAGQEHTCAVLQSGAIECWGDNAFGELGDGTTLASTTAVPVNSITNAAAVSAGFNFTCALLTTGTAECWGSNASGQLGTGSTVGPVTCGSTACSLSPVAVQGVTGALAIGANGNSAAGHACALFATSASCWGDNTAGQLGDNSTTPAAAPVTVLGLAQPTGIAVGGVHTCAPNAGGGVDCWGSTTEGQVGSGTSTGPDSCPNVANACSILPVPVRF